MALTVQLTREPEIPTPDEILEGYERASRIPASNRPLDLWCWQVVQTTIDRLGEEEGPTFLRIARHRARWGSLHGCRIGTVTATKGLPGSKGKVRAENELLICLQAAYEKWLTVLLDVAGRTN